MKSISELTEFYHDKLYPVLEVLEERRKQVSDKIYIARAIILFVSIILYLLLQTQDSLFMLFVLYLSAISITTRLLSQDFASEFKDFVIAPLVREIDKTLKYEKKNYITSEKFKASNLFPSPDKFSGDDYIHGEIDGVKIEFSEVNAQKMHKTSSEVGADKSYSTIFHGLFIVTEFNKELHGETLIISDSARNIFGNAKGVKLHSKNITKDDQVKMDNTEFRKKFVVYSTDQIEARYILTHSLMERILSFVKKTKHKIYISFSKDSIYIAIDYNKELFEPSIYSSLLRVELVMEFIETLHLAIGVVEELKLNQKLWTKR